MGSCFAANTNSSKSTKSKSVNSPMINNKPLKPTPAEELGILKQPSSTNSNALSKESSSNQPTNAHPKEESRSKSLQPSELTSGGHKQAVNVKQVDPPKAKKKKLYDISPKVVRKFRIYDVQSRPPVQPPYSKDKEWQQILQLYYQKLNMASFQQNIGGVTPQTMKNKKQSEIQQHLEQIQLHREIELMVTLLNLRNRNWLQEQIKMSRRLASMQAGSFDSLVVTREYLQLREHFNWLVWAVGFYYFQMHKIEQFFQYFSSVAKAEADTLQSSRAKQQNMIHQEINHLFNQLKNLKTKLPSPISKKWTEGFAFQGVFFRMLPSSDSHFVKNEMKALKFVQNEVMELDQIKNASNDMISSPYAERNQGAPSIFRQMILPLLSGVECGGFFIFASPTIYIQNYEDDSNELLLSPEADLMPHRASAASKHPENVPAEQVAMPRRERSLSLIYGSNIYINHKNILKRGRRPSGAIERTFSFLQDNLGDIDDPALQMMPLLKNLSKANMIPIIDFEDVTQVDLNYLVLHVYDCIPAVGSERQTQSTAVLQIPGDHALEVKQVELPDLKGVSAAELTAYLKEPGAAARSSRMESSSQVNDNPFQLVNQAMIQQQPLPSPGGQILSSRNPTERSDDECNEELAEQFDAKWFSKHGMDITLICSSSKKSGNKATAPEAGNQVGSSKASEQLPKFFLSGQTANKRAQALYQSREMETQFKGLLVNVEGVQPGPRTASLQPVDQPQPRLPSTGEYILGNARGQAASYMQMVGRKESILRKTAGSQISNFSYGYHAGLPGQAALYADNADGGYSHQEEQSMQGNVLMVANNSASDFKLKYSLINHRYDCSLEQIFAQALDSVANILENSDTIFNINSLKELMHRKGLNLRFEWLLLSKVKSKFNRELIMVHILLRIIKKINNEEMKLKSQVFAPVKSKQQNMAPRTLVDHQSLPGASMGRPSSEPASADHFIGNQLENFKDNLVFFTNTLLRRKFSKQKHVFDEALIGLFLNRIKVMPIISSMMQLSTSLGYRLLEPYEVRYIQGKMVLDDIISAPSQNPVLFLNSMQTYFNVEMEAEFLRKCRQDKHLFLSQLTSQPMTMKNISAANLTVRSFYSLKEFSYFTLANKIYKSSTEQLQDSQRLHQIDLNQNLRSNMFRHQHSQKNSRADLTSSQQSFGDLNSVGNEQRAQNSNQRPSRGNPSGPMGGAPGRRDPNLKQTTLQVRQGNLISIQALSQNNFNPSNDVLNSSQITDKRKFGFQETSHQLAGSVMSRSSAFQTKPYSPTEHLRVGETPRQFNNIDKVDQRLGHERQHPMLSLQPDKAKTFDQDKCKAEVVMPAILYKLKTNWREHSSHSSTTNLLSFYVMPNQDVFNTWVMYLESILKEVYSIEGSEQILLEALNLLALNIYFGDSQPSNFFSGIGGQSPLISPTSTLNYSQRDSLYSNRGGFARSDTLANDFDRDSFMKVCSKIRDFQTFTSSCSPEVLVMSQIILGLSFEQMQNDAVFPIESEKCYLTALICLFHLVGDPRGRGNFSSPIMLLVTWKLSLLSLCTESRKVHDAEFAEELFDSALANLTNHKRQFRKHQNDKLNRVREEQDRNEKQSMVGENSSAGGFRKQKSSKGRPEQAQADSHLHAILVFEDEMDREAKAAGEFDIRRPKPTFSDLEVPAEIRGSAQPPHSRPAGAFPPKQPPLTATNAYASAGLHRDSFSSKDKLIGRHTMAHNENDPLNNRVSDARQIRQSQAQARQNAGRDDINSLLEANISEIDLDFVEQDGIGPIHAGEINPAASSPSDFVLHNFSQDSRGIPEVPFTHWSIYRQGIQNLVLQQGHKFAKNQKQLNKFLSQMFKNVLHTAIDKKILYPWLFKHNLQMHQSGHQWKNHQIKQAIFFQTAQMISSRSSSKSFQKNESEYSLSLSMQGSMISQGGQSYRQSSKTQHLGSYSSIINTENGSINKGDIHGVLYAWGSDAQGQLGLDSYAHLTKKPASQKILYPRVVSSLKDQFLKDIYCGYQHTLAVTIHGLVYSWGSNESGQLGLGPKAPEFVRTPKRVEGLKNVVTISAGNEHSAAINKNQELYTWGARSQTGQGDSENRTVPGKVEYFRKHKIQHVACGGLHTLALTKENKVYCWGSTEGGQLGLPLSIIQKLCRNEENAVKCPQQLVSLQDQAVSQIACGETHSVCLCKNGAVFGWGMSLYGQLGLGFSSDSFEPGLGMEKSKVMEPRRVESLRDEQVAKIYCGATFSLFLTTSGELFGCGMNDLGQLGEDIYNDLSVLENARKGQMQTSDITIPTQVSSLQGIQINTVACGEAHVLAIDGDGKDQKNMVWAWGQFKNGQLGLGEVSTKLNPRPVQNLAAGTVNKIACGSAHSLALIGDASNVTTLSPNYYAGNEFLTNTWSTSIINQ